MIQLVYIFKDNREAKEILLESGLSKDVHRYIRATLEYPCDSHKRVTFGEQVWITYFVPLSLSSDMFRKHTRKYTLIVRCRDLDRKRSSIHMCLCGSQIMGYKSGG